MDVGLEESHADLLEGGFHILRRQFAFAAQVFEDPLQLIA
jgi:hypothetical protein